MRITLRDLRRLIREFGVDDTLRNDAGFFMSGGISSNIRDKEASLINPPPGLGGPEEDDEETDEPETKSQPGARVAGRQPRRPPRT